VTGAEAAKESRTGSSSSDEEAVLCALFTLFFLPVTGPAPSFMRENNFKVLCRLFPLCVL